jgi:SAM-dependent methyltransferase
MSRYFYAAKQVIESTASHDEIYDDGYYVGVDSEMSRSAATIADSIVAEFRPGSVIDVGCGTGALLLAFRARGVSVLGFEYAQAAVDICTARGLNIVRFDLESDMPFHGRAAVVVSTEVAEHLHERYADRFVDILCSAAPVVVMTAATPDQHGVDHVNEQPFEYWVAKFHARGFSLDEPTTTAWRMRWSDAKITACYSRNVLVFKSKGAGS